MLTVTAAQRGRLARLRVRHPRAQLTIPARQQDRPAVRVRMRWMPRGHQRRSLTIWIRPDGTWTTEPTR